MTITKITPNFYQAEYKNLKAIGKDRMTAMKSLTRALQTYGLLPTVWVDVPVESLSVENTIKINKI